MTDETSPPTASFYAADHVEVAQLVWDSYRDEGVKAGRAGQDAPDCPYFSGIRLIAWLDGWSST